VKIIALALCGVIGAGPVAQAAGSGGRRDPTAVQVTTTDRGGSRSDAFSPFVLSGTAVGGTGMGAGAAISAKSGAGDATTTPSESDLANQAVSLANTAAGEVAATGSVSAQTTAAIQALIAFLAKLFPNSPLLQMLTNALGKNNTADTSTTPAKSSSDLSIPNGH